MKKTALSLILTLFCAFGVSAFFGGVASQKATLTASAETAAEKIDYAGQAVLDLNADSTTIEVEVKTFVDGDTTHFYAEDFPNGVLKARYAAVNTPESTGKIEEWGKKASKFTRSKLENAVSIIVESEDEVFEPDSTGERYLSWVWYKEEGSDVYRNLNIELLQEGLGRGSGSVDCRYSELCGLAIAQANELNLHVYSEELDPDFFYGEAYEIDLKGLRLNIENLNGKRVAFEGIVSYYVNQGVYVENFDEETQMYFGIYVYYGFNFEGASILQIGNKVRIVGEVSYYETGDSYQICALKYNKYKPSADDIQLIEKGHAATNLETTAADFNKKVSATGPVINPEDGKIVQTPVIDPETGETVYEDKYTTATYDYAQLAMNTSISMKGLYVSDVYTTDNGGDSDGAMTLTCKSNGKTVKVRTVVLKDSAGNYATEDMLKGKTIDVTGVIDSFNGEYQIKIISLAGILVDGEPLFPPVTPVVPDSTSSNSDTTSSSNGIGCFGVVALPAILPIFAAAVVLMKKREN
ncbi:MAG: thermonuclease family protein [Clostridia bacterium]|nr:thermonuclease family protein [Clostridia bacterium]